MNCSASYKGKLLRFLIGLLFLAGPTQGTQKIDITLPTDTLGPIYLPPLFIDAQTITVHTPQRTVAPPPWRYNSVARALYFSEALPARTTMVITFSTTNSGIQEVYSLYTPVTYDSLSPRTSPQAPELLLLKPTERTIDFSAQKDISMSVGSSGDVIIGQTLNVELSGTVSDSVTIKAHISDNSSSLEGETQEVGQLNKIYLTVGGNRWEATAGDITSSTDSLGILRTSRSPKGLQGIIRNDRFKVDLYGGLEGYKQAVDVFTGTSGLQGGIYVLKGDGATAGQVLPQEGSVELLVDGQLLSEGPDEEFVVDYANGSVRFTPRFTILDDQIIEIRYRYRDFEYTKFMGGLGGFYTSPNKKFLLTSSVLASTDDEGSSVRTFTQEEMDTLEKSGNAPVKLLTGREIHPNDVIQQSALDRIYRYNKTALRYEWESQVEKNAQLFPHYIVVFSEDSTGAYRPYNPNERDSFALYDSLFLDTVAFAMNSSDILDPIFLYVGEGKGTHTPYGEVILPQSRVAGEVRMKITPHEQFRIEGTGAGIYFDPNTFSEINNEDNYSGSAKGEMVLSTPTASRWDGAISAEAVYAGALFKKDFIPLYTRQKEWGIYDTSARYGFWSGKVSSGLREKFLITAGGGQALLNNQLFTNRFFSDLLLTLGSISRVNYHLNLIDVDTSLGSGRRHTLLSQWTLPTQSISLMLEEEWLEQSNLINRGYLLGELQWNLLKLSWRHKVQYKQFSYGSSSHSEAQDSLHHILWEQMYSTKINTTRTIDLTTSLLSRWGDPGTSVSLLGKFATRKEHLSGRAGTGIDLFLTSESNTERRWQYLFVGMGNGTHIKDTATGIFIEDPYGDYVAKEITLWGTAGKQSVRNGFAWDWFYKTPQNSGLSEGLRFKGLFTIEEDILPHRATPTLSWIPGFTTVLYPDTEDSLSYSLMRYTQGIQWSPPQQPTVGMESSISVEQRQDQSTQRRILKGNVLHRKSWNPWQHTTNLVGFMERRENLATYTTAPRDLALLLEQQIQILPFLAPFLGEMGGILGRDGIQGFYGGFTPGMRVTPAKAGQAEVSYTFAQVSFDGEMLYPMANGYLPGINHRFLITLGIHAGKHLTFTGNLRSEKNETLTTWQTSASMQAVLSL